MSQATDNVTARLVERARDPSRSLDDRHAAFTRLVERSQAFVFGLALSLLRDVEEAKDASQEAFALAWRRLEQLREPAAFDPWLKAIVARHCGRVRRRHHGSRDISTLACIEPETRRSEYHDLVAAALDALPRGERRVAILFYFLGHSQPQIARMLGLSPGTVGKRLHSARLRIRARLPRWVRSEFVKHMPTADFVARVQSGLLDEYVGQYRFDRRPDHVVTICREGCRLISDAAGQRHILVALGEGSLVTASYDGEGRFERDRRGRITHFVYYEFGRRMGVARRIGDQRAHAGCSGAAVSSPELPT